MTSEETRKLLCRECNARVIARINADGTKTVRCPLCGVNDTLENATREAAKYEIHKMLNGTLGGFSSSSTVNITVTGPSESDYRFIME